MTTTIRGSDNFDSAILTGGTAGQVLVSSGTGNLPAWNTFAANAASSVRVRGLISGTTYTTPADVKHLRVFVIGATGGQLAAGYNRALGGIGGPGYSEKYYSTPAASYSYSIGAAGSSSGGAGGTTSWNGTIYVTGSGGVLDTGTGSAGGVGSGGDFNASGGNGGTGAGYTDGNGGGGGGPGTRAGNGYNGGGGTVGSGGGGGGGGGTGGAGGGGSGPAGSGGAAATAASVSAPNHGGYQSPGDYIFGSGASGFVSSWSYINCNSIFNGGSGGQGASSIVYTPVSGVYIGSAGAYGKGGAWGTGGYTGTPGQITVWEYI